MNNAAAMPALRAIPVALVVLALTGCGGGGTSATVRAGVVDVTLDEYSVAPQTIHAHPGPLTFVVRNGGRLAHNLRLRRGMTIVGGIGTIRPGVTARVTLTLHRGTYTTLCSVNRHETLGEHGTVIVR